MIARTELNSLQEKKAEIDNLINDYANQQSDLLVELAEHKFKIVLEEGLLSKTTWCYWAEDYQRTNLRMYLKATEEWKHFNLKDLTLLYKPNYHDSFALVRNKPSKKPVCGTGEYPIVELHYNDGEVSLSFETHELGIELIKKWNLTINKESIESMKEEMDTISKKVASLAIVVKMLEAVNCTTN